MGLKGSVWVLRGPWWSLGSSRGSYKADPWWSLEGPSGSLVVLRGPWWFLWVCVDPSGSWMVFKGVLRGPWCFLRSVIHKRSLRVLGGLKNL